MSVPTTREGLKDYCLRALGKPVLEINVDDDQLEDRLDEAIDYFRLYHYDGIEKVYLKHKITASELNIVGVNATSFAVGSLITGSTSGAYATVYLTTDSNTLKIARVTGTFSSGETITNPDGITAVVASGTFYIPGDIENGYLPMSDLVYGVIRVLPIFQTSSSKNLFDMQYQLRLNDLYDLASTSLIYYSTVMQHIATLDLVLNGRPLYRFNRLQDRLYLDINWKESSKVDVDQYIVIEAYRGLDPTEFVKMYGELWLRHYTTSLFKKQWATNIKKFSGIQLPGGVTLDGDKLYDEAVSEIKDLEDEIQNKSAPLDFYSG